MRWQGSRRSGNIEDRRGVGMAAGGVGGLGLVVILIISVLTGTNPLELLRLVSQSPDSAEVRTGPGAPVGTSGYDERRDFVDAILGTTEDVWSSVFESAGRRYQAPTLVLFDNSVDSACGMASSAVGPFYCPGDRKVYLDLSFFRDLDSRFGAPGDFAQAYVIAHEVGHHVQTLLGVSERVNSAQQRGGRAEANALSVRQELQADCFAGVWGYHTAQKQRDFLEDGDIEEGLNAAAAIGDDRLQRRTGGAVAPESWTHGSSAQRAEWLRRGLRSGDINQCDTFGR